MAITYEVSEYQVGDRTAEMIFTDDNGLVHKRQVNIPYIDENTIDEVDLQEIFEGQLRGVENKLRVNAVTFIDPTDIIPPETTEPTEEETTESTPIEPIESTEETTESTPIEPIESTEETTESITE